jgi:hypothetical protein
VQLYVKKTNNFPDGLPLTNFEELSATWRGDSISLPFSEDEGREHRHEVVGWAGLFNGQPCGVHVCNVRHADWGEGFLVYGGDGGVRIMDDAAGTEFEHLPPGYGMPFVRVKDIGDMPQEVRDVVKMRP